MIIPCTTANIFKIVLFVARILWDRLDWKIVTNSRSVSEPSLSTFTPKQVHWQDWGWIHTLPVLLKQGLAPRFSLTCPVAVATLCCEWKCYTIHYPTTGNDAPPPRCRNNSNTFQSKLESSVNCGLPASMESWWQWGKKGSTSPPLPNAWIYALLWALPFF